MKKYKILALALSAAFLLTACEKIDTIEVDGSSTTEPSITEPIIEPEEIVTAPPVLDNDMPSVPDGISDSDIELFDRAVEIVSQMTVEQKVGQLFAVLASDELDSDTVSSLMIGGVYCDEASLKGLSTEAVQNMLNGYAGQENVMLFTYEQGGEISPVSSNPSLRGFPFWATSALYDEGGIDLVASDSRERCILLSKLGFNANISINCAVLDSGDEMYYQTLGEGYQTTASIIENIIENYKSYSVGSIISPFPYGADDLSQVNSSNERMVGFVSAIDSGAEFVMMYSGEINGVDAAFDLGVHDALRNEFGFAKAVICDLTDSSDFDSVSKALHAGNDILIVSNTDIAAETVTKVREGEFSLSAVNNSVVRIVMSKLQSGIWVNE